jgi:hypothetical protein
MDMDLPWPILSATLLNKQESGPGAPLWYGKYSFNLLTSIVLI